MKIFTKEINGYFDNSVIVRYFNLTIQIIFFLIITRVKITQYKQTVLQHKKIRSTFQFVMYNFSWFDMSL